MSKKLDEIEFFTILQNNKRYLLKELKGRYFNVNNIKLVYQIKTHKNHLLVCNIL